MGDDVMEAEVHLRPGIRVPVLRTVEVGDQREVEAAVLPCIPEFIRSYGEGAEGGRGLGAEEAEALGELAGDQIPEGDVVAEHHEADVLTDVLGPDALGCVIEDHRHLRLEIAAPGQVRQRDGVAGPRSRPW